MPPKKIKQEKIRQADRRKDRADLESYCIIQFVKQCTKSTGVGQEVVGLAGIVKNGAVRRGFKIYYLFKECSERCIVE